MPYIESPPNITLHYLDYNPTSTKCIILIHGLGVNGSSWTFQIEPLVAAGYRVICPDMRGFGKSNYYGAPFTINTMSEDTLYLVNKLGYDTVDLAGISMGGTIALQFAINYPEKLKNLILINTFARLRPKNPAMWGYYIIRFLLINLMGLPTQAKSVARRIFPLANQALFRAAFIEQVCQANVIAYRRAMRALAIFNATKYLSRITIPTLVVTGANDTTVPLATQNDLADHIPNCKHVIIPNAGHAVSIDHSEAFNQVLISFLNTQEHHLSQES